uniref:Uncharacterized protein n=1 Tax=Zea mays TaxID=4577 RepID=C0PJN8_MAIZE|nr:unknown [Zea mays]
MLRAITFIKSTCKLQIVLLHHSMILFHASSSLLKVPKWLSTTRKECLGGRCITLMFSRLNCNAKRSFQWDLLE